MVSYLDDEMLIPEIVTVVFIGKDVDGGKEGLWYFQDAESFLNSGAYPQGGKNGNVFTMPDDGLKNVCELDQVIASLEECARRRGKRT